MKKRFLIPAVSVAALAGLAVFGGNIQKTCVPGNTDYENGTGICSAKNRAADNTATTAKPVEPVEPVKKLFQPTRYNVSNLAITCTNTLIKPQLRDPHSFRKLGHGYTMTDSHITVWVNYTATNGFGGRVRNTNECTYTR